MKIKSISIEQFKRFSSLKIEDIPPTTKLVVLTGPNGSGKSSLFEAFHFWAKDKRGQRRFDKDYHPRDASREAHFFQNTLVINFHDFVLGQQGEQNRKCFYIRSAYRHEADFQSGAIQNIEDILNSPNKLESLIQQETRVSENYNRIVGEAVQELFDGKNPTTAKLEIRDRLIGDVRAAMSSLFGDLILSGTGNPTNNGTFRFDKGAATNFHFG